MASRQERRQRARCERAGTVSRFAQQRVDERVMEIMTNRGTAERRDTPSDRALSARRILRSSG
jgi:hypothetical protein